MSYKISVIGAGVVGQATGRGFIGHEHTVEFIDVNGDVIDQLRAQGFDAGTPEQALMRKTKIDLSVLTVSTPTVNGEINLDYLRQAAIDLGQRLAGQDHYHVTVVRSTVSPGTTEDVLAPLIEEHSKRQFGADMGLCMNPEYLREVSAVDDFAKPWVITIGQLDDKSGQMLQDVYSQYECPKFRIGLREAEYQKYVHNLFNAVKIGFFNEMREVAHHVGIDAERSFKLVAESAEGMWNPRYGIKDLGPFDGMCLPKDTQAFLAWGAKIGLDMPVLRTVIEENNVRLAGKQTQVEATSSSGQRLASATA